MNEKDVIIRKQWLAVLGLSVLISLFSTFFTIVRNPSLQQAPLAKYLGLIFSLGCTAAIIYAYYLCSYKKPGTKLLTVSLIASAFSLVLTLIFHISVPMPELTAIPNHKVYLFVTELNGLLWIIVSWRLRKLNKRIKTQS